LSHFCASDALNRTVMHRLALSTVRHATAGINKFTLYV